MIARAEKCQQERVTLCLCRSWFGMMSGAPPTAEFKLDERELEELDHLLESDSQQMSASFMGDAEWSGSAWVGTVELYLLEELHIRCAELTVESASSVGTIMLSVRSRSHSRLSLSQYAPFQYARSLSTLVITKADTDESLSMYIV